MFSDARTALNLQYFLFFELSERTKCIAEKPTWLSIFWCKNKKSIKNNCRVIAPQNLGSLFFKHTVYWKTHILSLIFSKVKLLHFVIIINNNNLRFIEENLWFLLFFVGSLWTLVTSKRLGLWKIFLHIRNQKRLKFSYAKNGVCSIIR